MLPAIAKLNLYTVYRDRNDVTSFFDHIVTPRSEKSYQGGRSEFRSQHYLT